MEEIARNPGLQHIIEKSLTLLNIWDIASVKSVNQDFRKIVHSHEVISIISAGKHSYWLNSKMAKIDSRTQWLRCRGKFDIRTIQDKYIKIWK